MSEKSRLNFIPKSKFLMATSVLAAVAAMYLSFGQIAWQVYGNHSVVIASSPTQAEVAIEDEDLGTTPITVKLRTGSYTLFAKKGGYEPVTHAFFVRSGGQNLVNLQMLPASTRPKSDLEQSEPIDELEQLAKDVSNLKALLVIEPEEAASIPILVERVRLQGETIKSLRVELKDVREQGKWFLGSMIAIIIGLLGVIATLFIASRQKE